METLNYFLALMVCASGTITGSILARIAKSEVVQGKKYFIALEKILAVGAMALVIYALRHNKNIVVLGIVSIAAYLILSGKIIPARGFFLAGAFFFSTLTKLFIPTATLIFLHGLATGTLLARKKNKAQTIAGLVVVFIITAMLLFAIYQKI